MNRTLKMDLYIARRIGWARLSMRRRASCRPRRPPRGRAPAQTSTTRPAPPRAPPCCLLRSALTLARQPRLALPRFDTPCQPHNLSFSLAALVIPRLCVPRHQYMPGHETSARSQRTPLNRTTQDGCHWEHVINRQSVLLPHLLLR